MTSRFEKVLKISSDLLSYCSHKGATGYHLDISDNPDSVTVVIKADNAEISKNDYDMLQKRLHAPRRREIEQDYWELIGESEDFSELTLVGMLCDEASVEYIGKVITITLKRYH